MVLGGTRFVLGRPIRMIVLIVSLGKRRRSQDGAGKHCRDDGSVTHGFYCKFQRFKVSKLQRNHLPETVPTQTLKLQKPETFTLKLETSKLETPKPRSFETLKLALTDSLSDRLPVDSSRPELSRHATGQPRGHLVA